MKSIYMDERWGILQQEKEKGEAITYTYDKDEIRIIYPFIKRKAGIINGIQYFDIVTPRGQCGPWIENCDTANIISLINSFDMEFAEYCNKEMIVAEYIRFSPWMNNVYDFSSIYDIQFYGYLYCNDLTYDFFKIEYSSKKRNKIRKAEKNGVEIRFDKSFDSIEKFLELYSFTSSKYDFNDYYTLDSSFLEQYLKKFPEETIFAQALYKGEVISSAIILLGEDIVHYHFAANHPEYTSLQGNSLLIYKVSLYAAKKGKKIIDLGGARKGSALERFKKSFVYRGKMYPYSIGTKIRDNNIYNALIEKVGGPKKGYFPAYRK